MEIQHTGNCHHLLGALSEYLDGELESQLCAELEAHLVGCKKCRVVVDTLRRTVSLYQEVEQDEALPVGVRERLLHSLQLDEFNHS